MANFDANVGYDPSALSWTYTAVTALPRTSLFDAEYELVGEKAIELLNAAKRLTNDGSPASIENAMGALRKCCKAIAAYCPESKSPAEWADAFKVYLGQQKISEHTRWSDFNHGQRVIREAARVRQIDIDLGNPFKRGRLAKVTRLTKDEQRRLVAQARRDALEYYQDFKAARAEFADLIARARRFADANNNILPPSCGARGGWLKFLVEAKNRGLSISHIHRHLYATAESLIPFHVLITYKLAANVDAVSSMDIDAVTEFDNPILGKRYSVKLEKPRAGDVSPYTVSESGTLSIPWIIDAIREMTAPIRDLAPPDLRNRLFIGVTLQQNVRPLIGNLCSATFMRYARDRCGLSGVLLKNLRATRGIDEFLRTGDPFRAKRILKHKHLSTTIPYLDHADVGDSGDQLIANVQETMLSPAICGDGSDERDSGVSAAVSHRCKEPRSSDRGGLDEFGLCSQLLWPLNDRHFVMSLEPRAVAFFLRDYAALCEAEERILRARFVGQGYAARKHLMESRYLPLIDDELRVEAEAIIPTLPSPPWID